MPQFDLTTNVKDLPANFHKETTELVAQLLGKPSMVSSLCCNDCCAAVRCNGDLLVVYHLQQLSGNSGWKVNGTRLFGSFQWKVSRSNGTSEKVVLFFRTECSKRKFVYHLFKPNL